MSFLFLRAGSQGLNFEGQYSWLLLSEFYYFCIIIMIVFTVRWNAELSNICQVSLCNDNFKVVN